MAISFIVRFTFVGAVCLGLSGFMVYANTTETPVERTFQIPEGEAEQTLKQFAEQAGQEVLYWVDRVRGIRANAVSGHMVAAEALKRLIEGTGLSLDRDESTGALAINLLDPGSGRVENELPRVIKLNLFKVSGSAYRGYVASRTFVGGKTVLSLGDAPQTLQVVTRDIMDDTGAIDPNEVLSKIVPGVSGFVGPTGVNATIRASAPRTGRWMERPPAILA